MYFRLDFLLSSFTYSYYVLDKEKEPFTIMEKDLSVEINFYPNSVFIKRMDWIEFQCKFGEYCFEHPIKRMEIPFEQGKFALLKTINWKHNWDKIKQQLN